MPSFVRNKKAHCSVTHDISEAISFADTIYTLSHRPARLRNGLPGAADHSGTAHTAEIPQCARISAIL